MSYEAREGVDYIVDLYQIAGVEPEAEPDAIKRAIHARQLEYHPDRLQGLAPEFKEKGERMATLLNRASHILLDAEKRAQYDTLLSEWEGPVSDDGTPIITMDAYVRAELTAKSPDEIEDVFARQAKEADAVYGVNPGRLELMRSMLVQASPDMQAGIRRELDEALLAQDRSLALQEAERGRLVGYEQHERYEVEPGHAGNVAGAIEVAKEAMEADYTFRALGGVGTRLALLAGESESEPAAEITLSPGALPHYFEDQATKIVEIAEQREELLLRRLANFQPEYLAPEVQTEGQSRLAIRLASGTEGGRDLWIAFRIDTEPLSVSSDDLPAEVRQLLDTGDYAAAYSQGYNILTLTLMDHIAPQTLLNEAINKHLQKLHPDLVID